ncbi:Rad9/Ddc1, partial [Filobasidium floriforme]
MAPCLVPCPCYDWRADSFACCGISDFKKILQCIARFGDELHLQATHEGIQMSTVNSSKTAFCLFSLAHEGFEKYKMTGKAAASLEGIKCKLQVKSVLSVLGRSTSSQNILRLEMRIADPSRELKSRRQGQGRVVDNEDESEEDVQSNSRESRLILKLVCKHGVIKTHSLNLGASPFLVATVDPATLTNLFVVPARTLRDWLDHFAASGSTTAKAGTEATGNVNRQESELGWYFHPEQIRVRTWESGSAARRAISTELKIGVTEFDEYDVAEIVCLTFPLREFRAAITLADSWGIPLRTDFSTAGQPISLKLVTEHSIAELTIATTENEAFKDLM